MYTLRQSPQFIEDLKALPKDARKQAYKALRMLEQNPKHTGLNTKAQLSIHGRKAMRSRINHGDRILWEWGAGGAINLWRVGHHDLYKLMTDLPSAPGTDWKLFVRGDDGQTIERDFRLEMQEPRPFRNMPDSYLRIFGVPEAMVAKVKSISDAEQVWELPLDENVRYTLYDLLTRADEWTARDLLNTEQLLYRATADQLEGYCEGRLKQLLLNLNAEQDQFVRIGGAGPVLIKGVAGSGKTTIGLYRARHLAESLQKTRDMFGDSARILLLTYNNVLAKSLRAMYVELFGEDAADQIEVSTIDRWMLGLLRERGVHMQPASGEERDQLLRRARDQVKQRYPDDDVVMRMSRQELLSEIDAVIRGRELRCLVDYQAIERVGRGRGLLRYSHRPILWQVYERYQQLLDEANLFDWEDLARLVQQHCEPLPQFDVVIVDEAQDLPPSDLRLLRRLLPSYDGARTLTLLADPAQSIYYRGISWREAGIDIVGRTRVLAKNYRNTKQILQAARHIVDKCEDLKSADEFIPPTSTNRQGPKPVLVSYTSAASANEALVQKVLDLCGSQQYRPSDIAILCRNNKLFSYLEKAFNDASLPLAKFRDGNIDVFENVVKYSTMHSAKGLEFPVVFIIGLDDRFMPFIANDSLTRAEDELQERKLFYVSMTRASERLYMLHPRRNRCRFLRDLDAATITARSLP